MPHLLLYGPPGSGKSTLGRMLADSLRLPFMDLDEAVETRTGMPIPRIMEASGEQGFRDLEASVLCEQLDRPESVIALGGGTLLREGNRALAEGKGRVFCLKTRPAVLLQRLQADARPRPLLAGGLEQKLNLLLETRAAHYLSFNEQFDSDQPPEKLIRQLQTAIGRYRLAAMGSCDVMIDRGSLDRLGELLGVRGVTRACVVTDENVAKLYGTLVLDSLRRSGHDPELLIIPAGESSKTLETVSEMWNGFLQAGLDRKSSVIALGGGVVGDLAGFAASTYMRGIDWVCVPTSLLSMVDASLGGKTGFDLPEGKNLVGSFYPPRLVLADPDVLGTLPDEEFRSGLAEVVKHGIIADPELYEACAQGLDGVRDNLLWILRHAVAVKVSIIEADPYEKRERAALNFGHTVGHAVELVSRFRVRHGEAVAIGMVVEARLAERRSLAEPGLSRQIAGKLAGLGLPVRIPADLPRPELVRAMHIDKKKSGGVARFSLPEEIGSVRINVEVADLESVLEEEW